MSADFIGAGWAFPLRTDATGAIALVRGEREVVESIRLILGTTPGERPTRPEFGCALQELVFAPADAGTAGQIAYQVRVVAGALGTAHRLRRRAGRLRRRRRAAPSTSTSATGCAATTTPATWSSRSM